MLAIKTILYPTDFSERAGFAFDLACALARDHGARLVVLHVIELPAPLGGDAGMYVPVPAADWVVLREKLQQLRPAPGVAVEHRLAEGDPAAEIVYAAGEVKADLVVMGTHGRTGLRRLLMGSVAEQVVREAPCPVLTAKAPPRPEQLAAEPAPALAGRGAAVTRQ
jgi:nucleotide-binding universal stress UspA family protein